ILSDTCLFAGLNQDAGYSSGHPDGHRGVNGCIRPFVPDQKSGRIRLGGSLTGSRWVCPKPKDQILSSGNGYTVVAVKPFPFVSKLGFDGTSRSRRRGSGGE